MVDEGARAKLEAEVAKLSQRSKSKVKKTQTTVQCSACEGRGHMNDVMFATTSTKCKDCKGSGKTVRISVTVADTSQAIDKLTDTETDQATKLLTMYSYNGLSFAGAVQAIRAVGYTKAEVECSLGTNCPNMSLWSRRTIVSLI